MSRQLRWGILSTGRIAGIFAKGLAESKTGSLAAVGSRGKASAEKFAKEFGAARAHGSYEDLLADADVQAVYIATPHPLHAEWIVKAAEAGKHVLSEKPLCLNHPDAVLAAEACRRAGVQLMEAFMYRCHPQTAKIVEILRSGQIGELRVIQAAFSFQAGFNAEARLFKNALGGGGILDVGCYPVSLARLLAGVSLGRDFADPVEVKGSAHLGTTGIDEWAVGTLKFENGVLAQVSTGVSVNQENSARIYGSKGQLFVPAPWGLGGKGDLRLELLKGQTKEEVVVRSEVGSYALEADAFAEGLDKGRVPHPAMSVADSLGNMKTLDRWRESCGLTYEEEKRQNLTRTVHGRPLSRRKDASIPRVALPGLDKPLARMGLGCNIQGNLAYASRMMDDYYEMGGNLFDTAYIYGGGSFEKNLGQWVKNRGLRKEVVLLAKGAHSPHCNPQALSSQLLESLERLQVDSVDLYIMHRDNPEIPVGEFVDVLNGHQKAGRVTAFGGSNWSLARVEAFQAEAKKKGLKGFTAVSQNFSLAQMIRAPWDGCLASSDPASRAWYKRSRLPNLPWSSQAQGFFAGRFDGEGAKHEFAPCWTSKDNLERKRRVEELSKKKNCLPTNVALAWVLQQEEVLFPLIGPLTPDETWSSAQAFKIKLSDQELKWLDLQA